VDRWAVQPDHEPAPPARVVGNVHCEGRRLHGAKGGRPRKNRRLSEHNDNLAGLTEFTWRQNPAWPRIAL